MASTQAHGTPTRTATKKLRMAMVGIGVGGAEILPAMESTEGIELVAGADINPVTRERFKQRYANTRVYPSIEELCQDPDVDAVWVSSPNRFHAQHTIVALNHGKHVVVEKPMALSIEQAEQMVRAADTNGVKLLAGHTASYSLPIRAMRKIIASGKLGKLRALHVISYSDWMLRPRSADELDFAQGGGVPWRQTPHQLDSVRVLGGGMVRSVRGMIGQWMPERPIPGYYSAYLEFEDGTPCTVVHNGYGYFIADELVPWGTTKHIYTLEERVAIRKQMRNGTRDEDSEKQDQRIGGPMEGVRLREPGPPAWRPHDPGLMIVSCDRGDIRHSKHGLYVYDDDGVHDIDLIGPGGLGQRRAELVEFYEGVVDGKALYHDGRWGMATLEVALGLMQSARERREVMLTHQIPVAPDYDVGLTLPYLEDN
jgi:phthalate 4,5-cis-dihydrodiol dehydrogenase